MKAPTSHTPSITVIVSLLGSYTGTIAYSATKSFLMGKKRSRRVPSKGPLGVARRVRVHGP